MRRRYVAASLAVVLAAGIAGFALAMSASDAEPEFLGSRPPADIEAPDFTLPDQTGTPVSMRALRGKVVLVTFLDSQCTESCPVIAGHVARGLKLLSGDERRSVVALALSTDPEEDTPASVRSFLHKNRAEGELRYLVAAESELRPVWRAFNILASADSGIDELHSAPVRIYGRDGVWLATLHAGVDLTPENLAHDIRVALDS